MVLLELKAITFDYFDILTLNLANYNQAESYIISYGFFILILLESVEQEVLGRSILTIALR